MSDMRRLLAAILLAPLLAAAPGGEGANFCIKIDEFALAAPADLSIEGLALYLSGAGEGDEERARAIYRWMTANIDYDVEGFSSPRVGSRGRSPEEVLAERRGVCSEYSALFERLCRLSGLEAVVISGFGKGSGYSVGSDIPESINHAWNAVRIDGHWRLVDSTWGAGYLDPGGGFIEKFEEFYFLAPPEDLVWTHLPEDPAWQLLDPPISREEFVALPYPKPALFNNDIMILDPMAGTIASDGEAAVLLSAPEGVRFIADLFDERGEKLPARFIQIRRSGDEVLTRAASPGPGNYTLRIYSKSFGGAEEAYDWTLDYRIAAGPNARAEKGFPAVWDDFWDMGLEAKSHIEGLIEAGPEVDVAISAPEDVLLLARLLDREGRELPEDRTFTQRKGEVYVVRAAFPKPGDYTLRIYGKRAGDPGGEYTSVVEYAIVSGAGSEDIRYPTTLGAFAEAGARLIRPLEGRLLAGAQEFELLVPRAEKVAVINGGNWTFLTKEGKRFRGEANLSRGEARVAARFSEDRGYGVLLIYDVE